MVLRIRVALRIIKEIKLRKPKRLVKRQPLMGQVCLIRRRLIKELKKNQLFKSNAHQGRSLTLLNLKVNHKVMVFF